MADSEVSGGTPKRKKRTEKKKFKPETQRNVVQKNITKNSEGLKGESGGLVGNKSNDAIATICNNEGSANATPERKNSQFVKMNNKKRNNSSSKAAATKVQNQATSQSYPTNTEGNSKTNPSQRERNPREDRKYLMDMQRWQVDEERRKKWYKYFLDKPNDLLLLDRNKVVVLKTVDKGRPQAQFVCKICKYYCDNMSVVAAHIRKTTHLRMLQDFNVETTLREMPRMTKEQMNVLNKYLLEVVTQKGLDPADLETRRTIAVLVSDLVTSNLPGCSIRLFGSSIHGLGLKSSDVNIDLQVPEGSLPPAKLKEVASLLRKSLHFTDVVEKFDCEFPFISFTYKKSREKCSISLNNERAVNLALLLSKYTPLDPRLTQLANLFRFWGQVTETDRAQEGTWPGYAFYLLTIFYLQQCHNPVLPVLNDFLTNKGESESNNTVKVLNLDVREIKQKWRTSNRLSLAELWLGLLRFYTIDFSYTDYIVCIDSSAHIARKTRKIFIVDPFLPTRNVARSITSNAMFYYIMDCLMTSAKYFSMPQTKYGPLFGDIYIPAERYHADHEALLKAHDQINSLLIQLILRLDTAFSHSRTDIQERIAEVMYLMHNHNFQNVDNIPREYLERNCIPPRFSFRKMSVSPKDAQLLITSFFPKFLFYNFTSENCTGGLKVPKICGVCKREGHLKDDCPEEKLPPLEPLPERTPEAMAVLDKLCVYIFEKWKQSEEDILMREKICQELQDFIGASHPTAKLELFGSTKNGFGLKGSDMDICLTFEDNKTGEGLDTRGFIEVLYKLLKTFKELQDLLPIATAKVPIVKFTHRVTKLDGDISLYNVLALENSKLLYTYAEIDVRARILGYMMKRFSKVCHIGDASKGSLSSYAYTLLVIYFLQRCEPPVLPVLQELTENGGPPPKHIVESCNAYFFNDLSKLDQVWPGRGKNRLSVGELWLNLLIFYTEQFDMINNVVCIRCSRTVTKFEKLWISRGIAIEDPFDLSHNLGSALTRKMSLYIIKALRKGRKHFAHPVKSTASLKDIEAHYMNVRQLTDGEPPNDRGCRFCKSIGHKQRDCPEKKKKGRGKNKKKEDKPKKDTATKNVPVRNFEDDDDDNDLDEFSDSENMSSDQEDEMNPIEIRRKFEKQPLKKPENISPLKHTPGSDVKSNSEKASKNNIPKKSEHQNMGLPVAPPGFVVQDLHSSGENPTGSFPSPAKIQNSTANVPRTFPTKSPNISSVSNTQVLIPTIVFSNSKLGTDGAPGPMPPVRFPYSAGQEATRGPPPGFVPISPNSNIQNSPVNQKNWPYEGIPFYATSPTKSPNMEFMCSVPMYASASLNPSLSGTPPLTKPFIKNPLYSMMSPAEHINASPTGAPPRPQPVLKNLAVTGMLAPTEQLIWGQPTPPTTQLPSFQNSVSAETLPTKTITSLEASLAQLQLNNSCNSDVSTVINTTQDQPIQDLSSNKERNLNNPQNKTGQQSYVASSKTVINKTS